MVVASPNDVLEERSAVTDIAERINRNYLADNGYILRVFRWETDSYPGFNVQGPQGLIDEIANIKDCDILIGIFWKKFGTPITDGDETGTEHEIKEAYDAWKRSGYKKPQIMLYFNVKAVSLNTSEEAKQYTKVKEFKEKLPKEAFPRDYDGIETFRTIFYDHLFEVIKNINVPKEENISATTQTPLLVQTDDGLTDSSNISGRVEDHGDHIQNSANSAKILFISANPSPLSKLDLKREYNIIKSRISESPNRDKIQLFGVHNLKITKLQHTLIRYQPDFIHFAGSAEDRKLILLYDKENPVEVSFDTVTKLLELLSNTSPIKCVFVNACNTEPLAEALISYVDCAIGVRGEITDADAVTFAESFYMALSNGFNIEHSYRMGINQLELEQSTDISKPVIKSRRDIKTSHLFLIKHQGLDNG